MSGILDYLKILIQISRQQHTLPVEKVSRVFEEPYILTGYRPTNKPWNYYLASFFQLHNESLNVWTHAVAVFLVLLQLGRLSSVVDLTTHKDTATIVGFTIGTLAAVIISATAHLLHSKSPWWHYNCFLLDYAGVTFYSFGTGVATLYIFSHKYSYNVVEPFYLPFNVFMSWLAFMSCCFAKLRFRNKKERRLLMVAALGSQCSLDALTCVGRYIDCFNDELCSISLSLRHVTYIFLLFILSAVTFAAHFPERLKPGYFDIFFHGHQIFHLCTVALMMFEFEGIQIEVLSGYSSHTSLSFMSVFVSYLVLFCLELVTLIGMQRLLRKKVRDATSDEKFD